MTDTKHTPMTDDEALAVMDDEIASLPILAAELRNAGVECDERDAVNRLAAARATFAALIAERDALREVRDAAIEYKAAINARADAFAAKGRFNVNPLPYNHPACVRVYSANARLNAALARAESGSHKGGAS